MGCGSSAPVDEETRKRNREIEAKLQQQNKELKKEIKLLLLGTGESGKSTFFKQMKILSTTNQFTDDQKMPYVSSIRSNTISQMKVLVNMAPKLECAIEEKNQEAAEMLMNFREEESLLSVEVAEAIKQLWEDQGIQKTYAQRSKFQLNDSAEYFFQHATRFADPNYVPKMDDIIRVRIRTTGVEEAQFDFESLQLKMIDVGGQRSERRKWIHCLDCVTAVIYVISLNEYDQTLREDDKVNRMKESLALFEGICNSPWFWTTSFLIFFNKDDLFREKIKNVDLNVCFPEYDGGCNYDNATKFIKAQFTEKNKAPHNMYTHCTIAIDTENVRVVFRAVKDTLLSNALQYL